MFFIACHISPKYKLVIINSEGKRGERRRKEKKKGTAMANALIIWSLILCYYLFDSLSKIK